MVIEFGIGKNEKKISIKDLAEKLGQTTCQSLVYLHCLSGCDTTSSFKDIGKKKAYDTMKAFPEIVRVIADFYNNPFQVLNENYQKLRTIDKFVFIMYSQNSIETDVNLCCKYAANSFFSIFFCILYSLTP